MNYPQKDGDENKALENQPPAYHESQYAQQQQPQPYVEMQQHTYPQLQQQQQPVPEQQGMFYPHPDNFPSVGPIWTNCTLNMNPVTNLIDPVNYPKSTKIYSDLCRQFGQHNIIPPPQWLQTSSDASRIFWLKSGFNSQLYFLLKKDKHTAKLQQLANEGFCCPDYDQHLTKILDNTDSTSSCYVYGCNMLLCFWPGGSCCCADVAATQHSRYQFPEGASCCGSDSFVFCGCCCGSTRTRKSFISRLTKAGVNIDDDCSHCWVSSICCRPCTAAQQQAAYLYYLNKRWGVNLNGKLAAPSKLIATESPEVLQSWLTYFNYIASNELHPYNREPHDPASTELARVAPLDWTEDRWQFWRPHMGAFLDLSNTPKAIEMHNQRWKNVHMLTGISMDKK